MPATVAQVQSGIKNRLATINGLRAFEFQPDNQIAPPYAFAQLNSVEYHRAFQGGDIVYDFTIFVIVGRVSDRTAQASLDAYLSYSGAQSVRSALEADLTLGGIVSTLIVSRSSSIRSLSVGDAEYLSIEIALLVHG